MLASLPHDGRAEEMMRRRNTDRGSPTAPAARAKRRNGRHVRYSVEERVVLERGLRILARCVCGFICAALRLPGVNHPVPRGVGCGEQLWPSALGGRVTAWGLESRIAPSSTLSFAYPSSRGAGVGVGLSRPPSGVGDAAGVASSTGMFGTGSSKPGAGGGLVGGPSGWSYAPTLV